LLLSAVLRRRCVWVPAATAAVDRYLLLARRSAANASRVTLTADSGS